MRVRVASSADLRWIKPLADRHRQSIGFVVRAALAEAVTRRELLCVPEVGFCHFHTRRDGWSTVYEIVSEGGVGRLLLNAVPRPVRLKCPEDLPANAFYLLAGGVLVRTERGKRRPLNVWEWAQ